MPGVKKLELVCFGVKILNLMFFGVKKSVISVFLVSAENGAGVNKMTNIMYDAHLKVFIQVVLSSWLTISR